MLYLFDLDGTLISSYMDNPNKAYHSWHVLPGRKEMLRRLLNTGQRIGIVTNQGGVAFGHVTEGDAYTKLDEVRGALGIPAATYIKVCFSDPRSTDARYNQPADCARRKPSGGMLREMMADFPQDAAEGVLFVGDRPEDEAAAHDAGVPFQWAHEFFA